MPSTKNIDHSMKNCIPLISSLPLVDYLIEQVEDCLLDEVCIIGGQHLLQTTHLMFQALYVLGLKPSNIYLIGKCYSSNSSVYSQMLEDGINVCQSSISFKCYQPFDQFYKNEVSKFYKRIVKRVNQKKPKKIIVLDDGGEFLIRVDPNDFECKNIIGIEQTSSGYNKLINQKLKFPIINVARSWAKLKYESPIISVFALEKFLKSLPKLTWDKVLIMGGGAIGLAIKENLKQNAYVDIFDTCPERSSIEFLNKDKLSTYDLIIGCTGSTSIPYRLHNSLKEGCILASVSSSDREFDAHYLRKKIDSYNDCHLNVTIDGKLLLNSGFPINFDGGLHSVPPKYIQFTRSLLVAAIFQSMRHGASSAFKIMNLCSNYQKQIKNVFFNQILTKEEKLIFFQMQPKELYRYA